MIECCGLPGLDDDVAISPAIRPTLLALNVHREDIAFCFSSSSNGHIECDVGTVEMHCPCFVPAGRGRIVSVNKLPGELHTLLNAGVLHE